jgi:hypothetical protein
MRVDERDIPGASDYIEDAPDLLEVRTLKRGRVPKREWPEVEVKKPRKKQRTTVRPTPTSTQTSIQSTTHTSTNSFKIYEDEPEATASTPLQPASKRTKQKHTWKAEYVELKNKSTQGARDYLVQLIGNDEYPEVLRVPAVPPEVLLDCPFLPDDPLLI